MKNKPTKEQQSVLNNDKKNLIVSASAGSGKTFVVIEYITKLICENKVPVKRLLVLTFTKAAAGEMRERLNKSILKQKQTPFLIEQIDDLTIADISTIDAFCEKVIKRNLNKTNLDENFKIIDNEISRKLKEKVFAKALEEFESNTLFNEIYFAFKKNKNAIYECLDYIHSFITSLNNGDDFLENCLANQEEIFDKSCEIIYQNICEKLNHFKSKLLTFKNNANEFYADYIANLNDRLNISLKNDFKTCVNLVSSLEIPLLPRVKKENKDQELESKLRAFRKEITAFVEEQNKYNFLDTHLYQKMKHGTLAKAIIELYKIFKSFYLAEKKSIDALDFADLEEESLKLLNDKEVLERLQSSYDYIFVDEYQDTNRIQEAIVKPIAGKGNFIAVGDPKQGIYGFRNATMEIMRQDIKNFDIDKNSQALFLRGNFRSDKKILDFINKIFSCIMTENSVGIDYQKTSMLEGLAKFQIQSFPAVRVDIISCNGEESEQQKGVYSVKQAPLEFNHKNEKEVQAIVARIDELLKTEIYDPKEETYRKTNFSDIAILFRGRSALMEELNEALIKNGFPVICDSKNNILDQPEIAMLINLLNLTITMQDDIALASVMLSKIGGFSVDELAKMQMENSFASLYEYIINSANSKIIDFISMLNEFKNDCLMFGIYRGLEKLFYQKDYYAYLLYQEDGEDKLRYVQNFMHEIVSSEFNNDIALLVSYLTKMDNKKFGSDNSSADAILLTTIHATKGLEYPIVVLAGCGEKLEKPLRKNYIINKDLGLATFAHNNIENIKSISPQFAACKLLNKKREFIDEIMIFYVALTRAKNHLYIVGSEEKDNLLNLYGNDIFSLSNYLQFVFYAFGQGLCERLFCDETVKIQDWEFNNISQIQDVKIEKEMSISLKQDENIENEIKEYFNFQYKFLPSTKLAYKNSVTKILNLEEEEQKETHLSSQSREVSIMQGNSYHKALKLLDFEKIENVKDLKIQLELISLTEEERSLLDNEILFKDIYEIKQKINGLKIIKEKPFVMSAKLSEIFDSNINDEVLVQGVIDLFAIGEENILIDYKWTSEKDEKKILNKYKKQLQLYSLAIKKGLNINLNKIYIFSLKNGQFIEYFNNF